MFRGFATLALVLAVWLMAALAYAACTSPGASAGGRQYFTTGHTYKLCTGSSWVTFGVSGTAGACGSEAAVEYDSGITDYKFCNGTNWQKVQCTPSTPVTTTIFLTSTSATSWTVPRDWNNTANTVEIIGGGGKGSARQSSSIGGTGGGGGEYVRTSNVTLTSNTSVPYSISAGGGAADTWFNNQNLILSTNNLIGGNGNWSIENATFTQSQADAHGGNNATLLTEGTGANTVHGTYQHFTRTAANTNIVAAVEAKAVNGRWIDFQIDDTGASGCGTNFDLTSGTPDWAGTWGSGYTLNNMTVTGLGSGWWRIVLYCGDSNAVTNPDVIIRPYSASAGNATYTGDGSSGLYLYGLNVTFGTADNGFTPTTTSALYSGLAKAGTNGTTSAAGVHQTGGMGDLVYEGGNGFKPGSGNAVGGGGGGAAGPSGWGQTATTSAGGNSQDLNLMLQSNTFNNATSWILQAGTLAAGQTDPFGGSNAWSLTDTASNNNWYRLQQSITYQAQTYIYSVYAKAGSVSYLSIKPNSNGAQTAFFNLSTGVAGSIGGTGALSSGMTSMGNGWYRCWFAFTATSTSVGTYIAFNTSDGGDNYTGTGTVAGYLYGSQVNLGSALRTYSPTTTSATWVLTGGAQGANGNAGTDFDGTHGAGSGAGGRSGTGAGFTGGNYGGGGSGTGTQNGATVGAGAQGLIVINYLSTGGCGTLGTCSTAGQVNYFSGGAALGFCDGTYWRVMAQ